MLGYAQGVPELMYFKFDGTGTTAVPNLASSPVGTNPAAFVGTGLSQGPSGQFGNALIGTGAATASGNVNTGWTTNLTGDWTISFWTSNIQPSGTLYYIFGDPNAGNFRCFTNGIAGANNWMLRGTGITDVTIPNGATTASNTIHFVHDAAASEIRGYLNGVLVTTVPQAGPLSITSTVGPFTVGGQGTNTGLSPGGLMDEFRIYNRALSATEITSTWNQTLPFAVGPIDLALGGLSSPLLTPGSCFGPSETVTANLFSFGTDTLNFASNNAQITINVTGPNPQTFTTTLTSGTLLPGASLPVTLSTNYNMAAGGVYTFSGFVQFLTGGPDANLANDTLSASSVTNFSVAVTPGAAFTEDFETFSTGNPGTLANGWTRSSAGNTEGWLVESNGVQNTTLTGPITNHTPGGQIYMYIESTAGLTGTTYDLTSPCLDLTGVTTPVVSFWYHMFGSTIGSLSLVVKGGSSTGADTTIWTLSGSQQFAETDPWKEAFANLTPWAGDIVQLAWRGEKGGPNGDIAIDDVSVFQPIPNDLGIVGVSPTGQACLTPNSTITVLARNQGSNVIDFSLNPVTASVVVSGASTGNFTSTVLNSGTLGLLDTVEIVVTTGADLSAVGFHIFAGAISMTGDANLANDSILSAVESLPTFTYPFTEDFESFVAGAPGTFANGWYRTPVASGNFEGWTVETNGIQNTANTGPINNNTPGGTTYLYLESSGGPVGTIYELLSPCILLTGATTPQVSFFYHMFGSTCGPLSLVVKNGSSTGSDTTLWTISGQQQTSESAPWLQAFGDLTPWVGSSIQLAFVAEKIGVNGDVAIDDVSVFQPLATDVQALAISPNAASCYTSAEEITVAVRNVGANPLNLSLNPLSVTVNMTGAATQTFTSPVINTGTIGVLDTLLVTVTTTANLSVPGTYTLEAITNLVGDLDASNDTTTSNPLSLPIQTAPLLETFETFVAGSPGTLANGWTRNGGGANEGWLVENNGIQNSTQTGPLNNHTPGGQVYMYLETSAGGVGSAYDLISPCIDLVGLTSPKLSFWYHMFGATMGTMQVVIREAGVDTTIWSLSGQQQTAESDPYIQQVLDLDPWIGASIQVIFVGIRGTSFTGDMAIDDVNIFNVSPDDVATTAIKQYDAGCGLSATEVIEAEITNVGSTPVVGPFNVNYSVNGGPVVTQSYTGTLQSFGDSDTIVFTTTADLSGSNIVYNIQVWTSYPIDSNPSNDTLLYAFQSTPGVPFFEDFETFTAGSPGTFENGWSITTPVASAGWFVETNGVQNSTQTGPLTNHTPGGQVYVYTETSGGSVGSVFELIAPCISLAGVSSPQVSFWYHMFGATMGTMSLVVRNGSSTGTDTTIWSLSGQQQNSENAPWLQQIVDLTPWAGGSIELVWVGIRGTSFTGDMAIDDVNIFQPYAIDVGAVAVTSPNADCGLSATQTLCFDYVNNGFDTLTATVAKFSVNGGPFSTLENIPGSLLPGDTANYCFTATADLSTIGLNEVMVVVTHISPLDSNAFNDTIVKVLDNRPVVSTFPYTQDFESAAWALPTSTGNPVISLPEGWVNVQGEANQDWAVRSGTTPSANTGPPSDHTTGSGRYLYVEDTSPFNNDSVIVSTPCFDVSALLSPVFSFWYHSNNPNQPNDENELHVDLVFNGTTIYDIIPPIGHKDNNWNLIEIGLGQFIGTISVRFRVNNNNNFGNHDIAIDDIRIVDLLPQDAGITLVAEPVSGCGLLANDTLVLALANLGVDTIFGGLTVNYSINGGPVNSAPFTDTLLPGFLLPFTFSGVNLATPGDYVVTAWTSGLVGDSNFFNDSVTTLIKSVPQIASYPYSEDFESGDGGWSVESIPGSPASWGLGTPAKPIIQGAASGVNAWATGLNNTYINTLGANSVYNPNESSWVISPCFDFSALTAPTIEMNVWWSSQLNQDGTVLQATVNNGASWVTIGAVGDPDNWYNNANIGGSPGGQLIGWSGTLANSSNGWVKAKNRMDFLAGEPEVRLRVAFGSNVSVQNDGFAFDDIFIFDTPSDDVGVDAIVSPAANICGDDSTIVAVTLTNYGIDTATSVPVFVEVTGAGTSTFSSTFTGTLAPDSSTNFVVGSFNTSVGGTFNLLAYSVYSGDTLTFNDSAFKVVTVTPVPLPPVVTGDSLCSDVDSAQFTLTAFSPSGIENFWYDSLVGGTAFFVGDTFQTPFLSASTTYYVSSGSDLADTITTTFSGTNGQSGNMFDVTALAGSIEIDSLDQIFGSAGTATFEVYYVAGGYAPNVNTASAWTLLGTTVQTVPAAGVPVRIPIGGLVIPAGQTYGLYVTTATGPGVRYSTLTAPVIYSNADIQLDLGVGKGYPFGATFTPRGWNGTLYYSAAGCVSERVPVTAAFLPAASVDLGPDGIECAGFVVDANDPSLASYVWNTGATTPSITVDSTGLYFVDVVNISGCTGSDSILLTINPSPSVDLGPSNVTACGVVTLDAGNPGATYVWSEAGQFGQTLQVTSSGTYSVTVNLLGCEDSDTVSVTVEPAPIVDLGPNIASCAPVTLNAGNPGANYLWSTGETTQSISVVPPVAGSDTITLVVTNSALCDASDEIIISAGVPPVVNLGPDLEGCDSVVLDAGIANATSYLWTPGGATTKTFAATASGTYSVSVIDALGCEGTDEIDVTVNQKPVADFTIDNLGNFTYAFTSNAAGVTSYEWDFGDGAPVSNDPTPTHQYQFPGLYVVTLTVTNDCGSDTKDITLAGVSIDEAFGQSIKISPNPTRSEFFVSSEAFTGSELSIEVNDTRGRLVYREVSHDVNGGFRIRVDLAGQPEGVYLVKISDGERTTYKRVVRE